jgi:hypothetical protein
MMRSKKMSYPDFHGDQLLLAKFLKELGFLRAAKLIFKTKSYDELYKYADVLKAEIKKQKRQDMMVALYFQDLAAINEMRNI